MSEKQWTASEIIHLFNTLDETQGLKIKHKRVGNTDGICFPKHENIELFEELHPKTFLRIGNKLSSEEGFLIPTSWITDVIIIASYEQYANFWSNHHGRYR